MNIFQFAQDKEAKAEALYRGLEKSATNPGMKSIFKMLADVERKHFEVIGQMARAQDADHTDCHILDRTGKIFAAFSANSEAFDPVGAQVEIYRKAQKNEEASEKFYREKAKETDNENHQKIYLILAQEEADHYALLEKIIQLVGHPESGHEDAEFYRPK